MARSKLAIALIFMIVSPLAQAADEWTFTADIPLVSSLPVGGKMLEEKITADLLRPKIDGRAPAAVIINSSGGVSAHTELFYGRLLAAHGVAALVVDSFTPRGVRRTTDDQSRVWQTKSNADAAAGFRWLAKQPWVDVSRIIVLGMSRGGGAAISNALEADRKRLRMSDVRFAAHVATTTGGCALPPTDARTTGAPLFFMIAELDDYTPARPCLNLVERMRAAGNTKVRYAVYPGVYHAYEWTAGIQVEQVERWQGCRLEQNGDGSWIDLQTKKTIPDWQLRAYALKTCIDTGPVTIGGDSRVKAQAVADLLQFLRDSDIIADRDARAILPDCSAIPDGIDRQNCDRARAGWTGSMVALARAYRYPGGLKRDDELAARLFRLASDRGHGQAQWELSLMLRDGLGTQRDLPAAVVLARKSADAGEAPAMNILGVMARDGIGRPGNDQEAAAWFRAAAEMRHGYGLANLGRMYWFGRGGLTADRTEAVRLWRKAVYYENPWGRIFLAEAMRTGDGAPRDLAAARELLAAAAAQDRDSDAKRRAGEELALLEQRR
jgi:dienelactone hydrolase